LESHIKSVTLKVSRGMGIEKFQNRATRIVTNNKFDASSRPLIERLGWKTIEELIAKESKTIVYNSLYGLTPQYLYHPFVRNFVGEARRLRNTFTALTIAKAFRKWIKMFFVSWGKTMEQPSATS